MKLVKSLTEANTNQWDMKFMNRFIEAYYKASAYANDEVIKACNEFLTSLQNKEGDEVKVTNLMSEIYNAVRKDINKKARSFNFGAFSAVPLEWKFRGVSQYGLWHLGQVSGILSDLGMLTPFIFESVA